MTDCTRQPGTVWPACKCPDCRAIMARLAKRHRSGIKPLDQRDAAWARLEQWHAAGYTPGLVSTMTGVGTRGLAGLWTAIDRGERVRILHRTAAAILAADDPTHGRGMMTALGARRRLQALAAMGWSIEAIRERYDVSDAISKVRNGRVARTHPQIVAVAKRAFDDLWDQPGPSRAAKMRAGKLGWAPPLAWDNIDDPDEQPHGIGTDSGHLSVDDIDWFLDLEPTATAARVAERFGLRSDAVQQCARRAHRQDLLDRLVRNAELAGHNVRRAS